MSCCWGGCNGDDDDGQHSMLLSSCGRWSLLSLPSTAASSFLSDAAMAMVVIVGCWMYVGGLWVWGSNQMPYFFRGGWH